MKFDLGQLWPSLNFSSYLDLPVPQARDVLPGHQSLGARDWKNQLALPMTIADHWVYLSGNSTCPNPPVCNVSDEAIKTHLENHPVPSLSFIDCDAEPILCQSWILAPPALMYISVTKAQDPELENNVTMRPFPLPVRNASHVLGEDCESPQDQIACIFDGRANLDKFPRWNGFLHPFIGTLGKKGGGLVYGYLRHVFPWLPLTPQSIVIALLLLLRFFLWLYTPPQRPLNPEDLILKPEASEEHAKSE